MKSAKLFFFSNKFSLFLVVILTDKNCLSSPDDVATRNIGKIKIFIWRSTIFVSKVRAKQQGHNIGN